MHPRLIGRWPTFVLALSVVAGGCTSAPSAPAATPAAAAKTATQAPAAGGQTNTSAALSGEITYAWWGTSAFRNEVSQKVITLFQQKNPSVKVNPSIADFNNHFQKLTVSAAAGDLPCVPQMQSTALATYADPRILRPLDDLVENKTIDTASVSKEVLDTGRGFDGKLYMVPTGVFSRSEFYNDALLKETGIAPPAESWTWDDYKTLMTQVQAKLPAGMNALENNGGDLNPLVTWVLGHGEPMFQQKALGFSKPTLAAWFQFWEDLRKAGVATSETEIAERQGPLELHPLSKGATIFGSYAPNQVAAIQDALTKAGKSGTIQVMKEPNGPGGSGDAIGTNGLTIGANCDNVTAAAAFINFFLNDPAAAAAYKSDNGAVVVPQLLDAQIKDPSSAPALVQQLKFQQHLMTGGFVKPIKYAAGYAALSPLLTTTYQNVAFGRMSITAAVDDFFNQANAILNK